jgi:NAD(P)-dependent dehydrogenase (short-subunit alcohol dehydrogenase family)
MTMIAVVSGSGSGIGRGIALLQARDDVLTTLLRLKSAAGELP